MQQTNFDEGKKRTSVTFSLAEWEQVVGAAGTIPVATYIRSVTLAAIHNENNQLRSLNDILPGQTNLFSKKSMNSTVKKYGGNSHLTPNNHQPESGENNG